MNQPDKRVIAFDLTDMEIKDTNIKIIAWDLDDTLCTRISDKFTKLKGNARYKNCTPIQNNILLVNEFYDKGYYIVIYTARGMTYYNGNVESIYKNLYKMTKIQLKKWGVKYHELIMGKIHYDVMIDDKSLNINGKFLKDGILTLANGYKYHE